MLQRANELFRTGQLPEANILCREILARDPANAEGFLLLATIYMATGALAQAADAYAAAARHRPGWFRAVANHGIVLARLGRFAEAENVLREALRLQPDSEPVLTAQVGALRALGRNAEAADAGRRAVAAGPDRPEAWTNLGDALHALGQLSEAAAAFEQALKCDPRFALAAYNLAHLRNDQWRGEEARAAFARAIELDPGYPRAWHAFLFNSLYDPEAGEQQIFERHARWAQRLAASVTPLALPDRDADTPQARRIRVGYVSPDFRDHPCARFLQPLFAGHDHGIVEVFAYSAVARPDGLTEWFRSRADQWRVISGMDDRDIAELVRADRIDILVDLAGHTLAQPIGMFALQAAPVQLAWLGYPATTGLPQIGFRLTDDVADPPGVADDWHAEKLLRLPGGFLCYQAPADIPPVAGLPAAHAGMVTFGSFNNLSKVTPKVIATWAAILREVPRSRLVLKARLLRYEEVRARITETFAGAGIAPPRFELHGWIPRRENPLLAYQHIDVALDTFPYNGATTTFEALSMGVPVITLRGHRHAGRVGASILTQLGRPAWIAGNADEYVAAAAALASDLPALAAERAGLRARLSQSGLTDGPGFARRLETVYRRLAAGPDDPSRQATATAGR